MRRLPLLLVLLYASIDARADGAAPLRALLESPVILVDESFGLGEARPRPGAAIGSIGRTRFGATVQRLRGCRLSGDALVTVQRDAAEEMSWVVVHREGRPCFRLPFPEDDGPARIDLHAAVLPDGSAGPLAIVHSRTLQEGEIGGVLEREEETHLIVVSWSGKLLLDRALRLRSFRGRDEGEAVLLRPVVWRGKSLSVWASVRTFRGAARQCIGSLLDVPIRGGIAVAEGVPCSLQGLLETGDGELVYYAATRASEHAGASWQAAVDAEGDFRAVFADPARGDARLLRLDDAKPAILWGPGDAGAKSAPRLHLWPWDAETVDLPADLGVREVFDWDGDGTPELLQKVPGGTAVHGLDGEAMGFLPGEPLAGRVDGPRREVVQADLACGARTWGNDGESRCAPGDVGGIGEIRLASRSFDWSGDGTPDLAFVGVDANGQLWLAGWIEGDLVFSWPLSGAAGISPLHQSPRALALTGVSNAEILQRTGSGFAIRSVPDGQILWEGLRDEGIVDAWAAPTSGASSPGSR